MSHQTILHQAPGLYSIVSFLSSLSRRDGAVNQCRLLRLFRTIRKAEIEATARRHRP